MKLRKYYVFKYEEGLFCFDEKLFGFVSEIQAQTVNKCCINAGIRKWIYTYFCSAIELLQNKCLLLLIFWKLHMPSNNWYWFLPTFPDHIDLPPVGTDTDLALEQLPQKVVADLMKVSQWLVEQAQSCQHLKSYGQARALMLSRSLQG